MREWTRQRRRERDGDIAEVGVESLSVGAAEVEDEVAATEAQERLEEEILSVLESWKWWLGFVVGVETDFPVVETDGEE